MGSFRQPLHFMTILFGIGLAGDMNPSGGAGTFPNQLIDVGVVHQPFEPFTALFDAVEMDVGGFSCQVLTGGYSTYGFVQGWTSVTAADPYGLANMLTQGFQYFTTEGLQGGYVSHGYPVVNLQRSGFVGSFKFRQGKVFAQLPISTLPNLLFNR